jgi:hydrogenase maturation protease
MTIAVIGLGNVLLGDDGFGPFVIELLCRRYAFPPGVELLDLGTPGLGLVSYLPGHDAVVIVDTVAGRGRPGDLCVLEDGDLERMPVGPRVSPHDPAVAEALSVARAAGDGPREACVVGVVPGSLALGAGLGAAVRAAAGGAAERVRQRIEARGLEVRARRDGVDPAPDWWRARC